MGENRTETTEVIPVTFHGHFGCLHRPKELVTRGTAVVICPAAGRDARWSYRALFLWANQLAACGYEVLRYDHLGEGDSLPLAAGDDQWTAWLTGVRQAADFARAHTRSNRLALTGMRIGATLAACAAKQVRPDGLVLWDPLPSGAAWLRELTLSSAMLPDSGDPDVLEVHGLRLSAATQSSLRKAVIDAGGDPWPETFLAGPTASKALADKLGDRVRTAPFLGYGKLFKDAHVNEPPTELFEATLRWLDERVVESPVHARPPRLPDARLVGSHWTEQPVEFGDGLRGVLCLPAEGAASQGVILTNTGGDPRAGVANFSSRACRALAAAGVGALRFDFRGTGESAGDDPVHVYETDRVPDLRHAAALLSWHGMQKLTAVGVCTGGFHAVRSVLEPGAIHQAVAINAWVVWRPGTELDRSAQAESMRAAYLRTPVQARRWIRVVRGAVRTALMPRALWVKRSLFPDAAARAVRAKLRQAAQRGARIRLLVGDADRSREGLEDFGWQGAWLARQPGVSLKIRTGLDHGLFELRSQLLALQELFEFLGLQEQPEVAAEAEAVRAELVRSAG